MKPLLKWAGGKRWLLPLLQELWVPNQERKLVEPFAGGLAVALGLNPKTSLLNDSNQHLINFYQQVSQGLILKNQFKNQSAFYYRQRAKFNKLIASAEADQQEMAALFYYLIRTGFNGLCRFNSSGQFNVPFGQHAKINYRNDFTEYQPVLSRWQLSNTDFANLKLHGDEFIYADPPYDVEFTKYNAIDFKWDDQLRLAAWLAQHSGPVIASNQATDRILDLYRKLKFKIILLEAPRRISCNGDRKPALEMLACKNISTSLLKKIQTAL